MCLDPVTLAAIASAAISAVGAVSAHNAQEDQAEAQAKAVLQNRDAARMDNERAMQQAAEAAAGEANTHAMQARRDMAAFDAITGEAGGGVSAKRQAAAIGIQNGQDLTTVQSNARKGQAEIGFGDSAAGIKASQQLASIKQPSMLETGLTIAGAGVRYQTTMNDIKYAKGKP